MSNDVKVLLKAPHTHEDKQYKSGDTLTVTPSQADWLIARGVAEIVTTSKQDK